MGSFRPPGDCPNCAEFVPPRSHACPHCGATAGAGWDDDRVYDGLDLPDEAYEEAGEEPRRGDRQGPRTVWIIVAVLLLAALTAWIWLR